MKPNLETCLQDNEPSKRRAMSVREAALVLADGEVFEGEAIGAERAVASGEVVFNTVLSGYQEVITDPSYAGQIITFTYPHIGNYGATEADNESRRPFARGVIVRELARRRSSWRSDSDLDAMLCAHDVPGIAGVDTRRLTRHLRDAGAMPGAFGPAPETELLAAARRTGHRGDRPRERGHHCAFVYDGERAVPRRGLRPRHQAHDPAPPR